MKTSAFHEGIASSLISYLDSIDSHKFVHTCHLTDNNPQCDGPKNWKGEKPKNCAGAIMMLLKTGKGYDLQLPLLQAARDGLINLKEAKARTKKNRNVFTIAELLGVYAKKLSENFYGDI